MPIPGVLSPPYSLTLRNVSGREAGEASDLKGWIHSPLYQIRYVELSRGVFPPGFPLSESSFPFPSWLVRQPTEHVLLLTQTVDPGRCLECCSPAPRAKLVSDVVISLYRNATGPPEQCSCARRPLKLPLGFCGLIDSRTIHSRLPLTRRSYNPHQPLILRGHDPLTAVTTGLIALVAAKSVGFPLGG